MCLYNNYFSRNVLVIFNNTIIHVVHCRNIFTNLLFVLYFYTYNMLDWQEIEEWPYGPASRNVF